MMQSIKWTNPEIIWKHTIVTTIIRLVIKLTQLFNYKSTPLKDWNWPPKLYARIIIRPKPHWFIYCTILCTTSLIKSISQLSNQFNYILFLDTYWFSLMIIFNILNMLTHFGQRILWSSAENLSRDVLYKFYIVNP